MGFFRLALALCVVASHTSYFLWVDGRSAVFIFYVISGYLITRVLNEVYVSSNANFYANRALRIFVPATVVFVLSSLFYCAVSASFPPFRSDYIWVKVYSLLSGIVIFFQDFSFLFGVTQSGDVVWHPYGDKETTAVSLSHFQYNAALFTVAIELYFYILAPFIVRKPWGALGLAWVGFAYHALTTWLGIYSLAFNYHILLAAWFYFGSGAVCYWVHRSECLVVTVACYVTLAAFSTFVLQVREIGSPEMYLALILALPALIQLSRKVALDAYLGHYSYLIYIVHVPAMQIYAHVAGIWPSGRDSFWIIVAASFALAAVLHHAVERPVEILRARIRGNAPAISLAREVAAAVALWIRVIGRITQSLAAHARKAVTTPPSASV
jgi:peptidoglycan/LPS O-acetylase OafA/YrhL